MKKFHFTRVSDCILCVFGLQTYYIILLTLEIRQNKLLNKLEWIILEYSFIYMYVLWFGLFTDFFFFSPLACFLTGPLHWLKPSKVRGNICLAILEKGQPSYQILIPRLQRKSWQFPDGSSKLHIKCSSASVRRRLSVSNLSQCHIKWSTVS
jgi:hypothetical protein